MGDLNGDGRPDIITSEERYPGEKPNASLYWYEPPADPGQQRWRRHRVTRTYSLNNLDVADLDRDGDLDTVSIAWDDYENLHLWRNDAVQEGSNPSTSSEAEK